MVSKRIIPCLLLKGSGLYKTIQFKNPVYLGDAINVAKIFNEKFVDEIVILDITASLEKRGPNFRLLENIASSCFIPVTYGGGITSVETAQRLFSLGIEKLSINTAASSDPHLIHELAKRFGSQSVVVSVNISRNWLGKPMIVDNRKRKIHQGSIFDYFKRYEELGAGEIFINDIDRDGTMTGFDIPLIKKICLNTSVPVVACGGAGCVDDLRLALNEGGASGVAAGSLFVFSGPRKAVLITYPTPSEIKEILHTEVGGER